MIVVIMPPSPHLPVNIFNLIAMLRDEIVLICGYPPVNKPLDDFTKEQKGSKSSRSTAEDNCGNHQVFH
jgi:hypothetical protein